MTTITRRRFLHDGLLATSGLSLMAGAVASGDALAQGEPISFDLHAHPGAFYTKGRPEYPSDSAFLKTVAGMRDGRLTGAFFSLVADAPLIVRTPTGIVPSGVYAVGDSEREYRRQLTTLQALLETTPAFLATRSSDLLKAQREQNVAAFLACEGGEFLDGQPERVDQLYADGVRSLQLVHYVPNVLGDLQTQPRQHGGLSALGKAVVKRATAAGMVLDVAHAAFDTVRDVASHTSAPIILSHSILTIDDSRPLAARAISEEHARLVATTGGVIGAWPSGFNASFDEFVANTKRLIDVVGIDHVGLGTDMDGNFKPVLSSYAQVTDWAAALEAKEITRTDLRTGQVEVLADNYQGKPFVGPNDVTIDSRGRLYVTDLTGGAVYRVDGPGQLARILAVPDIQRPNGIQISPDDKQLYLIEANGAEGGARMIRAYDLSPDGTVSNMRVHYNFYPGRSADGMSIDTQGNLYASAGMNQLRGTSETLATKTGVYVISPLGKLLTFIPIPEDFITNNAFGGSDMKTLYVTAGKTVYKVRTEIAGLPR